MGKVCNDMVNGFIEKEVFTLLLFLIIVCNRWYILVVKRDRSVFCRKNKIMGLFIIGLII